jgi:radical SAM superfamily enzyme YgiQ (UPF0313 family)
MQVLLVYCDSGSPSRFLRFLEVGQYHQLLADGGIPATSLLLLPGQGAAEVAVCIRELPDCLVGFYLDEFNGLVSLDTIDNLKSGMPGLRIAVLGIYPTLAPDRIMASASVDFMIVGEGEVSLFELATQLSRSGDVSQIRNLWWRRERTVERNPLRPLQDNIDTLPYPNRALFDQDPARSPVSERVLYLCASRGCPFDCIFCYSPVLKRSYEGKGTYFRMRSASHVASEILGELRRTEYSRLVFVDELFPTDKPWLRSLAQRLGGISPVPFQATVAVERCDTDTLDLLRSAGCERLWIGVETGNEGFRKRLATRNLSNERLGAFVSAVRERGMSVTATAMVGLPLESEPLTAETVERCQALGFHETICTAYQPIEGTQLEQYARDKGYESQEQPSGRLPDFTRPALQLPELSADAIRASVYRLHFLGVLARVQSVPSAGGYLEFIRELPKAQFRLHHSSALDVAVARHGDAAIGYLSVEAGSECRFPVLLRGKSVLRFLLMVPEATLAALRISRARLTLEALWAQNETQTVLFERSATGEDLSLSAKWHEALVAIPADFSTGEMVLRVRTVPDKAHRACVFLGAPVLAEQEDLVQSNVAHEHLRAEFALRMQECLREMEGLREALAAAREGERRALEEREEKARRLGELHVNILELEKVVASQQSEIDTLKTEQATGLAGRLKGLFKK